MKIDENSNLEEVFKKREVPDYSGFIEGDYEPSLGKTIKTLIISSNSFIVYLDQDMCVEWSYNEDFEADNFLEKFGLIVNKIGLLEELSNGKLEGQQLHAFRRLLGESMGRILDEQSDKNALKILDSAEQLLNANGRKKLLTSALITTIIILIIEVVLWLVNGNCITPLTCCHKLFQYCFYSLAGGIGGFVFLMIRSKTLELEPSIGDSSYTWEGILRITYGIFSGFIVYLALNSKIVFGNLSSPDAGILTYLICLISGVSEKLIPGIIKKIEDKI